jgi:endonuclease YncB( thermonuclease family)
MLKCFTDPFSNCCKRFTKSLPNCSVCNFKNAVNVSEVELDLDYLDDIRYLDTVVFAPPITAGKVIKVYDGDTITVAAKLPHKDSPMYRFSVRLNGIDCPEIKGKTEEEKIAAKKAQQALEKIILHKIVILKNVNTEKYGRLLADVYLQDLHLNQYMLDNKYAVPYDGGTKKCPESWANFMEPNISNGDW